MNDAEKRMHETVVGSLLPYLSGWFADSEAAREQAAMMADDALDALGIEAICPWRYGEQEQFVSRDDECDEFGEPLAWRIRAAEEPAPADESPRMPGMYGATTSSRFPDQHTDEPCPTCKGTLIVKCDEHAYCEKACPDCAGSGVAPVREEQ